MKIGNILIKCDPQGKKLVIPEGITHIEDCLCDREAFEEVEELVLPDSLVKIGLDAFYGLENLKQIEFGNSLEEISDGAFSCCISLKDIKLPGTITWIGKESFECCKSLERVSISSGKSSEGLGYIEQIGEAAFRYCNSLVDFQCEKRVEDWGSEVFSNTNFEEFVCPDMVESRIYLPEGMFEYCTKLKRIVLPRDLEEIGQDTFRGCKRLNEIVKKDDEWVEVEIENGVV